MTFSKLCRLKAVLFECAVLVIWVPVLNNSLNEFPGLPKQFIEEKTELKKGKIEIHKEFCWIRI
jgi:hypothetical protein